MGRRFRPPAAAWFWCALAVLASVSFPMDRCRATVRHFVYGLDPRIPYDVRVGDRTVLEHAFPGAAGDLEFTALAGHPVRIVPTWNRFPADTPSVAGGTIRVLGPMPNPSAGTVTVILHRDAPGAGWIRIVDPATGRVRVSKRIPFASGETPVRFLLDPVLPSGVYSMRIEMGNAVLARKLVLVRGARRDRIR